MYRLLKTNDELNNTKSYTVAEDERMFTIISSSLVFCLTLRVKSFAQYFVGDIPFTFIRKRKIKICISCNVRCRKSDVCCL